MIRRLRISYGSLVIEDIQNYGTLMRMLTNVTVGPEYANRFGCINEAMGSDALRATLHSATSRMVHTSTNGTIAGIKTETEGLAWTAADAGTGNFVYPSGGNAAKIINSGLGNSAADTAASYSTHTYALNLAGGVLTSEKLWPLKWLANQLTIEIELDEPAAFLTQGITALIPKQLTSAPGQIGAAPGFSKEQIPQAYLPLAVEYSAANLSYDIKNCYFVAEILEFDSTYDAAFYQGMLEAGVPIKFASWHGHTHVPTGSQANLTLQERSRSVKSAFAVIRKTGDKNTTTLRSDPNWFYPGVYTQAVTDAATWTPAAYGLDEYQWRLGGRYFPSQPVKLTNGAAEAVVELQKALNVMGNYALGSSVKISTWQYPRGCFVMAGEFESTNGFEISGINAEELSDLSLIIKTVGTGAPFDSDMIVNTFVHYDGMIIIRPNNVMELIQ